MKYLVIAEKPSVARSISKVIGASTCFRSSRYKYQANVNTGRAGIYQHGCKSA